MVEPRPPAPSPAALRPQVVAHRGASAELAEHTLAAYERAIAYGADALECDVRLTRDGHLVCVHDRRIERTSNGVGAVSAQTLDQLARYDYSDDAADAPDDRSPAHRGWRFPERLEDPWLPLRGRRAGRTPPPPPESALLTFARLLDLVTSTDRRVELAVETKHPSRYAGYVERELVSVLDRFGLAHPRRDGSSPVRMMSFSPIALRRMRDLAPGVPRVFLMDDVPLRFRDGSLPFRAAIAGPSVEVIRRHPSYVARVHARGGAVHVWTVDTPADVDRCVELGVDAIITNRPAEVLARLAGTGR